MAKTLCCVFALGLAFLALSTVRSYAAGDHHVVGDDKGWDQSTDVGAWSKGRIFRVGDNIWFTYSAALESIAELRSIEEYEACDLTAPLKLYSDGLDKLSLDEQGHRFFISNRPESCKNGLKLHIEVAPSSIEKPTTTTTTTMQEPEMPAIVVATGPTPSSSVCLQGVSATLMWFGASFLCFLLLKV